MTDFITSWTNRELCLFRIPGGSGEPEFMAATKLSKTSWVNLRETRVDLLGVIPFAIQLLKLSDGDDIFILRRTQGPVAEYDPGLVAVRFYKCKIIEKLFDGISTYEEIELYLQVTLECEMEFIV
jgi:hypothetical protein